MIDIKNIKVGDRVQVSSECVYTLPLNQTYMHRKVYPGEIGFVTKIETLEYLIKNCWPVRVHLDGHDEGYLFGLNELDYVD